MSEPRAGESAGPLLAYYSDDFTGGTDALEVLATAGVSSRLFVEPPAPEDLKEFPGLKAVGVAGESRALPTAELEVCLREALRRLSELRAPILHYKICSTFDSSPEIGSIGRAIELGAEILGSAWVPIVVGAPPLGRYCVFGNLFARSGLDTEPFRLDLHPTMSRHPVTPMAESDLRILLAAQTAIRVALYNVLSLAAPRHEAFARFRQLLESRPDAVLIDVLLDEHLPAVGQILWEHASTSRPLFAVGSSGVEMALVAAWNGARPGRAEFEPPGRSAPMLVVSGSCSPVTDEQIKRGLEEGFAEVSLDVAALVRPGCRGGTLEAARQEAERHLMAGRSAIVHTARGPSDPRIAHLLESLAAAGRTNVAARAQAPRILGSALGELALGLVRGRGLRRLVIAGGDTSRHAAKAMGVRALEMLAPMAPGSPLCRAHAPGSPAHGLEICFKGGQVGTKDFLVDALDGRVNRRRKEIGP